VKVSVIVPVRDDPRVDDLLASLANQRGAPGFEVLVAMDGSTREPQLPAGMPARLLRLPPRGAYAARNAAVREADGEVLLFTDSDCLPPSDWIATASLLFDDPTLAALQGDSRATDDSRLSRLIQSEYERYVAAHAAFDYRYFCNTRNFGIRSDLARQVPMPETFARGGDGVYGRLLEGRGISIRYEPGWWVGHRHPTSRREEGRRAFERGRDGARWARASRLDLFDASPAPSGPGRGPGAFLLRNLPGSRGVRRAASLALLPIAAAFAAASAALPGRAADRSFSRFCRACHLAGRLRGESETLPGG
jgi:glycosyltransferase involved in cell wall biosynthesis